MSQSRVCAASMVPNGSRTSVSTLRRGLKIGDDRRAANDAVVDLALVTVDVEDRAFALEAGGIRARLTNVKATADHDQAVRFRDGEIRPAVSVAPDHARVQRMMVGQNVAPHQRVHYGDLRELRKAAERLRRVRATDATAGQKHGTFRLQKRVAEHERVAVGDDGGPKLTDDRLRRAFDLSSLNIHGNINQNRPRATRNGHHECLVKD